MNKVINFNKNASREMSFSGLTKARVRTVEGELQIRPTNRLSAVNLPKTEKLIDLRPRSNGNVRMTIPGDVVGALAGFQLEARKHGWMAMIPVTVSSAPGQANPAGGSVSDR
jgi:hypothetical protein